MSEVEPYCNEGCGRPATVEVLVSLLAEPFGGDDFTPVEELTCVECAKERGEGDG